MRFSSGLSMRWLMQLIQLDVAQDVTATERVVLGNKTAGASLSQVSATS